MRRTRRMPCTQMGTRKFMATIIITIPVGTALMSVVLICEKGEFWSESGAGYEGWKRRVAHNYVYVDNLES